VNLKPFRLQLIFVLFAALFAALFTAKTNATDRDFAALLQQLDAIKLKANVAAYAVVIASDKQLLLSQVRGVSKAGSKQPVSPQAYFRIGSITKTFVSLGALAAEQQGKLKLADQASKYLNKDLFSNPFAAKHPITIAQLLEHSAGFSDMGRAEFASNDEVTLAQGLKRFAKDRRNQWMPGQSHSYSNTSYGLAGRVLEKATGNNIIDWLKVAVFTPLGMTTATMILTPTVKKHLVPGYQADGIQPIPYWHMIYPSLGAINLQPRDMAKLIQFYLSRRATQPKNQQHRQQNRQERPRTTLAAKQGLTYGYGLGLYQWYNNGQLFFGHGGDADGYLARFAYQKQANLGYFFVINSFNNQAKNQMQTVIERFIVDKLPEPVKTKAVTDVGFSAFAGVYHNATRRFSGKKSTDTIELKWDKKQLYIRQGDGRTQGKWDPLVHTGKGLFRRTFEPAATTAIFIADGQYWLQGDEGNYCLNCK
jgi:CubicO group peptidase (beta-lactamase class C family)